MNHSDLRDPTHPRTREPLSTRSTRLRVVALGIVLVAAAACAGKPAEPESDLVASPAEATPGTGTALDGGPYAFAPPVFDIAAAPNGNILVPETVFPVVPTGVGGTSTSLKELRLNGANGEVREIAELTTVPGSPINGIAPVGSGSFYATTGGKDLALGAGVLHVSRGGQRLIGDVEAFETAIDPDATGGPQWKIPACEFNPGQGFSAGPQSNPYHLAALGGGGALVADAAGNSLLHVTAGGELDWVAVFTPPVADGSSSTDPADWMVLFPLGPDADCYVQPVPNSVAVGPDGAYYVGELTGVTPADIGIGASPTTELSRVWRIEAGASNVTCPSAACQQAFSGFTSIIDVEFGPDGMLYVVEYDEANWFVATTAGPTGGTINRCDSGAGTCTEVASGLPLPSAITFDKWGGLWLLENNLFAPTVRRVDLP